MFPAAGLLKLFHDAVMFSGPFLLEMLLKHLQDGGSGVCRGRVIVPVLSLCLAAHLLFQGPGHLLAHLEGTDPTLWSLNVLQL